MEATLTPDIPAAEPQPARQPANSPAELLGRAIGRALAPLAALGARLRGGRVLHPAGTVCAAEVLAAADDPLLQPLAHRLAGAAVVRLSGALWRSPGPPELLGCALRFRGERPLSPDLAPEDQDLLLATTPSLWLLLPATLRTRQTDYLHNAYFTAGKLEVEGLGPVDLRLVPHPAAVQPGTTREGRLAAAMESGAARLRLDLRRERRAWQPLCDIRLRGRLVLDEDRLCFSPLHAGQDLRPRGFLAGLRAAVYAAGQRGRTPA